MLTAGAASGSVARPVAQTTPRLSTKISSAPSASAAVTVAVSPSYTGLKKRHSAVPCSSQAQPQRMTGRWVM